MTVRWLSSICRLAPSTAPTKAPLALALRHSMNAHRHRLIAPLASPMNATAALRPISTMEKTIVTSTWNNNAQRFPGDHARSLCRSRLGSALRTAMACAIVAVSTVYGPVALQSYLTFPAFSYVTAILIVGEATLGDSLHGAASALYGSVIGVLPAMLTLMLIRPEAFSLASTTLAVSLSAFVVALPESTNLVAKRIALGQVVIIYVANSTKQRGGHYGCAEAVMHPVHIAASTAVGVVASVVALLFPYPRLACYELRKKSKLFKEIATERLRLLSNAFFADNKTCRDALISEVRCLTSFSAKLLQNIKLKQAALKWEKPLRFLSTRLVEPSEELQEIEAPLQGMEMAISSIEVPINFVDQQLKWDMTSLRNLISLRMIQDHFIAPAEIVDKSLHPLSLPAMPQDPKDLPPLFFLFCLHLLNSRSMAAALAVEAAQESTKIMPTTTEQAENSCKEEPSTRRFRTPWCIMSLRRERLAVALKCSLSLGLSVFFGVLFSKEHGFWASLTVAVTITPWREATFKLANLRAQGTTLGSVYGVLGSLIPQNLMELRLLVLLPWILFTSFLQRSRMYGSAGGIAAVISALIILGRTNYGSPTAFTIARLTETFIGFSCSVFAELLLQPTRASSMAREQLSQSLRTLRDCIESLVPASTSSLLALKEKKKKLRQQVNALRKYIGEAEAEPSLWFLPFPVACYSKLHSSMSKMVDLLLFLEKSMALLVEESHGLGVGGACDEIQENIVGEHSGQFKKVLGSSLQCFEEVIQVKSLAKLEMEYKRKHISKDEETGKIDQGLHVYGPLSADEEDCRKAVASFLQHAKEVVERHDMEVGGGSKSQLVLCLCTIGFCVGGLMKETRELEKGLLELVQRENPGTHINLHAICCKAKELSK